MRLNPMRVTDAMRSPNKLTAAPAYVAEGCALVVTHGVDSRGRCTCGRKSCGSPGKHPITEYFPKGVHSATTDLELIREALTEYPDANIAGALSGKTGVDVDGRAGEVVIDDLDLPRTATILTGRGHDHIFLGELPTGTLKGKEFDLLSGAPGHVRASPKASPLRLQRGQLANRRCPWLCCSSSKDVNEGAAAVQPS
jgi:hypothetical protein